MPNTGAANYTKCNPMMDMCAGSCIALAKAQYCSQPCVLNSPQQCNQTMGALNMGGTHGLCNLAQMGSAAGDLGFCSQACDAVTDCSDTADPGATCDMTPKATTGHGVCRWP